jgi:hypothetical protein
MGCRDVNSWCDQEKLLQGETVDKVEGVLWRSRGQYPKQSEQEQDPGVDPILTLSCITTYTVYKATFLSVVI